MDPSWDASGTFRGMETDEDNINKIKQNKWLKKDPIHVHGVAVLTLYPLWVLPWMFLLLPRFPSSRKPIEISTTILS